MIKYSCHCESAIADEATSILQEKGSKYPFILSILFLLFTFHFSLFTASAQPLATVHNSAFIRCEKLKYKAYYDSFVTVKVTAGYATLEVKFEDKKIDNRSTYHIIVE